MSSEEARGRKQSEKERERVCFILAMVSIALGLVMGYVSIKLAVRNALIIGVLLLVVYYQVLSKSISGLDKDELIGNTIFPFLTTWYATWVFLYNYFAS